MKAHKGYAVMIAAVASLGGILFGYDTAVIAGSIGFIEQHFGLSPALVGWAVSSALLGCLIGAMTAGRTADAIGRKKTLIISAVLFAVSAVFSAIPPNFAIFILARIVGGIGIGFASIVVPMYISEISPPSIRGVLTSFYQVAITLGILIIYIVNYYISTLGDESWGVDVGWRYMLGSEVLPALLFFLLLWAIPESPRWSALKGDRSRSLGVLSKITGSRKEAEGQLAEIEQSIQEERKAEEGKLLEKAWRPAIFVGIGLAILQQVSGINVIMYYATEILNDFRIGSGENAGFFQSMLIGVVNFLSTFIAVMTIDKFGRKSLLVAGSVGMAVFMTTVGVMIYMQAINVGLLLSIFGYIVCFAFSWGPIAWILISEIFPNRIRGKVMSLCIFVLWLSNIVVSQTFPMLNENTFLQQQFNGAFPFIVYGIFCLLCIPFAMKFVPETKHKTLEEIERLWSKRGTDWTVKTTATRK
ncbi:SP family arabinose:H+ symporter-like MFS transporter/SP family xylose:H+ symportor-like MFS transporter [Melghirimyces profundicolus]|uniref:SP family arabinose:H+ symporter-like MFS transporter/SP family xylose:H+ symportor-like MFS transporter n=2 Tax=Melghirimyces profundicolus TaxID=1242148 RepID=A0A2T6C7W2_9BACL|nr:SP family arabinose:H+ symporter-like MFS transporter/SP family xylose:H+ symportor-like MFS transporter [Melghirimyces profundicolus]